MKLTRHKLSVLTLALILLISVTAFLGINAVKTADASGTVTVSSSAVFTADNDYQVAAGEVGEGDDLAYYTTFTFKSNDDKVSYRRNLAYYWWQPVASDDAEETDEESDKVEHAYGEEGWFNMEIGFNDLSFKRFVITFESQQYNKTKDDKSVNYVIFTPAGDGKVNVLITDDKDEEPEDLTKDVVDAEKIAILFNGKSDGEYTVYAGNIENVKSVTNSDNYVQGAFLNVGGNYSKNSTSSTNPVYPLIFNAEFNEAEDGEEVENEAKMVLYSLNGQSFDMTKKTDSKVEPTTTVTDNAPPVLCLTEEFRYFELGSELDIDYVVIDVLRTTPTSTVYYYLLSCEDYSGVSNYEDKEIYTKTEDNISLQSDSDKYLPAEILFGNDSAFNYKYADGDTDKLSVDMLIKVYINLSDYSSDSYKETADIFLDWYVPHNYLININKDGGEGYNFLAVAKDELGVTYNYDNGTGWSDSENGIVAQYQAEVDKLAKNLSAGSSSYMYLPSAEILFSDNATAYTDLKFSVYYNYGYDNGSNTNLAANNLSINITKWGKYKFTIYATDAAGNDMYYIDSDGKVKEFAATEIWTMYEDTENGLYDLLPWFEFEVGYTGASFEEEPGMQSTAYVGTSYSSASFKINGISGSYETSYRLFLFDRAAYYNDFKVTFTYAQFIDAMNGLFDDADTRKYFREIPVVAESDANYEEFKDYGWTGVSTTFTPQDANAFYYIRAELKDLQYITSPVTCGLAVVASENAKSLKGENDWLKNNVVSVVLLCVAGVSFIGIILLLVIKPKDKGDIDVQLEKKSKKKNK